MHYPNNKETAYYIEGHVEYTWDDGKYCHEFHQVYVCSSFKIVSLPLKAATYKHIHHTLCRTKRTSIYFILFFIKYLTQADRKDDDGASITMDKNDSHILNAKSLDCVTLCIFHPALKGTETHDFSKKVSSF